jgi:hypothetical protein
MLMVAAALACVAAGEETDLSACPRRASIEFEAAPDRGLVEFSLTPEVFNAGHTDLADLRVVDAAGRQVSYVVRTPVGRTERVPLEVRLYNRTYLPGKQSSVTADFTRKALKNQIEVTTPGTDFRREALVEGSDDGESWRTVREHAFLFRVAGDGASSGYDKSIVALPDNDQRYLRVTVFTGTDDPERIDIQDVKAWRLVSEPPETVAAPIASMDVTQKTKDRVTEIVVDLGYRNMPLRELALRVSDRDFFRRVSVAGRERTERTVQVPMEDGSTRPKVVEEPWSEVSGGVIFRYSSGGNKDESLSLDLAGARHRYLRVRIENADDPPLGLEGASATRLQCYLAFEPRWKAPYTLYFGNADARRPHYDIEHYVDRLRSEGVTVAALGQAMANPTFGEGGKRAPWSERYGWAIWIALLGGVGVLALLVYRQAKAAAASRQGDAPSP